MTHRSRPAARLLKPAIAVAALALVAAGCASSDSDDGSYHLPGPARDENDGAP